MKKIILGLMALSVVTMAAGGPQSNNSAKGGMYIMPKVSLDLGSEYDNAWDTDGFFAGSIGVEGYMTLTPMFDLGLGIAFEKHAKIKDYYWTNHHSSEAYNSIPIYGIAKFNFPVTWGEVKPFMVANLGYSINTNDYDNGMYFGIGGGIEWNNFVFDLMYKVNDAERDYDWSKGWDADYSRMEAGAAYKFNM
jgi:hypothetical protein